MLKWKVYWREGHQEKSWAQLGPEQLVYVQELQRRVSRTNDERGSTSSDRSS